MADFRFKLLGLAAFATLFAGVSFGQTSVSCAGAGANPGPPSVRAESTAEEMNDFQWNCNLSAAVTAGQTANVAVYFNATVTSKALTTNVAGGTVFNEATLFVCSTSTCTAAGSAAPVPNGTTIQGPFSGVSNGTQLAFSNVAMPTGEVGPGFTVYFRVMDIRLNASAVALAATLTSLTAQPLFTINNSTGTITGGNGTTPIAYVFKSLAAPVLNQFANASFDGKTINAGAATPQVNNYTTCTGNVLPTVGVLAGPAFSINVGEAAVGVKAFKLASAASVNATVGAPFQNEGGDYVNAVTGAGVATFGTHVNLVFGSVPAGVTLYVPQTVFGTDLAAGGSLVMTTNLPEGGGTTASTATGVPAGFVAYTATNGTVTVVYEVTGTNSGNQESATIPVYLSFAKNSFTTAQGPITVVEGLGAQAAAAAATTIPNFAPVTAPVLNTSSINLCSTNLLFPFVTSALGFDTGIALADTSADPFGTVASPGTCALNFYGSGAPSPSTGVAAPNGTQNAGQVNTFLLSSVAPGFTGYMIAQCNYNFGHGFAYIVYSLTQNNGVSMGYLALVMPNRATGVFGEGLLN